MFAEKKISNSMSHTKAELKNKQATYIEFKNNFACHWLGIVITKADSPQAMEAELRSLMPRGMLQLVLIHLNAQLLSNPQAEEINEAIWSVHSDLHKKMQEDLMISRSFPHLPTKAEVSRIIDSTLDWAAENIRRHVNTAIIADLLRQKVFRPEQFAKEFEAAEHAAWPERLRNACRGLLLRRS